MAYRLFVPGAAFRPNDGPPHEYAALCDTGESLVLCHINITGGETLLQGQCQSVREVFERIDFGGCITLFLMVITVSCIFLAPA